MSNNTVMFCPNCRLEVPRGASALRVIRCQTCGALLLVSDVYSRVLFSINMMECDDDLRSFKNSPWALIFTWIPLVIFLVPLALATIWVLVQLHISGYYPLKPAHGSFSELMAVFGSIGLAGSLAGGIIVPLRVFLRKQPIRDRVAIISIGLSCLSLLLVGFYLWLVVAHQPR